MYAVATVLESAADSGHREVHMVYEVTTMIVSKHGLTSLNDFTCFSQVAMQWREQLVPAGPYGPRGCKASVLTIRSDPTHRAFAKGQFRQRRSNSK
nr:hypothetical protein CFP56_16279 [Quercus suber]